MKNYEAMKNMSMEEMAAVFYIFMKPIMDAFDFDADTRKMMRDNIRTFLNTEVKR